MNETQSDAWFYSREGERLGPVTFAELRAKAAEAGLNPRLDMVWIHGMPEWKPAGEIDGLFERRAATEGGEAASASDPYDPPEYDSEEDFETEEGPWPGARRRSFLAVTLIFPALWVFGFILATPTLTGLLGAENMKIAELASNIVPFIVVLYFSLQRLANLGMSRWWYLANFVPILNLWLGYRCFACPAGYAYHKTLDGVGVFLAILYWLMLLAVVLAIAAVIAIFLGGVGPDVQEQFQEILRKSLEPKS